MWHLTRENVKLTARHLNTKAGAQLTTADSGLVGRWQSRDLSQLIQDWADGSHVIRDQIVIGAV